MRVIVAGLRDIAPGEEFTDYELVCRVIQESGFRITELVSGGARGVDRLGERWAAERGIPVRQFIPEWDSYQGKSAGVIRNGLMAAHAEALIAIWDEKSRGTRDMLERALRKELPVHLHLLG